MGEVPRPDLSSQWSSRLQQLRSDRRVVAAVLACIAFAAGAAWLRTTTRPSSALPALAVPRPGAAASDATTATTVNVTSSTAIPTFLYVHVVGAVKHSTVVRLTAGARVLDAITAAGGATSDADLARLNLAAPLADGSRVAVPVLGEPTPTLDPATVTATGGAATGATPSDGTTDATNGAPVNLNTATEADLETLPGVGPATAAAIVQDRAAHGPFASVDDLTRVRGIGDAKLAQLRDHVTV